MKWVIEQIIIIKMNDSIKPWKWMVGLLAILNVILLVIIFTGGIHMQQIHHEIRMNAHDGKPSGILQEELKLTPEQSKQFEALKDGHKSKIKELMKAGHELRNSYFDLLKTDYADQKLVNEKAAAIASNQQNIELATFDHFQKVRQLCNAEQKKHFDKIINEVLRAMAPHGPPSHGTHHGPPPPHD
jgi:Spy/CpxP family protein refolding chaperone